MGKEMDRLLSLQRHRDGIASLVAKQKDQLAGMLLIDLEGRAAQRRLLIDARAELAEMSEAIEVAEKLVRFERAEEQFAKRQATFDRMEGLLTQQQDLAAYADELVAGLAAAIHELNIVENTVRTATGTVDAGGGASRLEAELLGALVRLEVLDARHLPAAYGVELYPVAAVRSMAHGARQFAEAIRARRPTESPAQQRSRADAREASARLR